MIDTHVISRAEFVVLSEITTRVCDQLPPLQQKYDGLRVQAHALRL